jgi:hypothetical protein
LCHRRPGCRALTSNEATTSSGPAITTTLAPATTATTALIPADLINPSAGTLAGVQVGRGPVEPILDSLITAYGEPETDTGWTPNECYGPQPLRSLIWDSLVVFFEETDSGQTLLGCQLDDGAYEETIELAEGIVLGRPYNEAATLYPDGAHHHESLELDGVVLQETPMLIVIAEASADGSAPIHQVWVGTIPTCH